jgi:hypothetical protein
MVSTVKIYEDLRQTLDERVARQIANHLGAAYEELQLTATKADMAELRSVVRELANAQQQTNATVRELAEAQKRTEIGLNELRVTVAGLAEAQKRTEARVEELAEGQKRTEVAVKKLAEDLKQTRADLGGLTHSVGYSLENQAYKALPVLLKRDFGLEVTGRLIRRHLRRKAGGTVEVNIIGEGAHQGKAVQVVGEGKTQLHRKDVRRFVEKTLPVLKDELGEVFPVLVTHMVPEAGLDEEIRKKA